MTDAREAVARAIVDTVAEDPEIGDGLKFDSLHGEDREAALKLADAAIAALANLSPRGDVGDLLGLLPEDADHRREFSREAERCGGPLRRMAMALETWSALSPEEGSYGKMLAIYSNEALKADAALAAAEAARENAVRERDEARAALILACKPEPQIADWGGIEDMDEIGPRSAVVREEKARRAAIIGPALEAARAARGGGA